METRTQNEQVAARPVERTSPSPSTDRGVARARELVLEFGWNSTSFQIVNPGIERWFSAAGDAVVGFVRSKGYRVVVGAPVCEHRRLAEVAARFEIDAMRSGEKICYFAAESRLERVISQDPNYSKFSLGSQPAWHPANWARSVAEHRSLRAQLNRARNKGVVVEEWTLSKARSNRELGECLQLWLSKKGLPPLHFMVESNTLERLENRRIFVAERLGEVVGFLVLSPVANRNGWLFEQFPHRPGAPNGTVELMIDIAMRSIAADGYEYATLGLSPLSNRAIVTSLPQPLWLRLTLGWVRKHGRRFYNFDGLDAFKSKLRPDRWEPVYAVVNEKRLSPRTLYAICGAFSRNAPMKLLAVAISRAIATELRWLRDKLM